MYDLFYNRVFFDPMVKGYYTEEFLELCRKQSIYFDPATEDLETIQHHTVDFLGINQYYPKRVRAPRFHVLFFMFSSHTIFCYQPRDIMIIFF